MDEQESLQTAPPPKPAPAYDAPSSSSTEPAFSTVFATLSLHANDRLRLLNFPSTICNDIRTAIDSCWPQGIQSTSQYAGSFEYKLLGRPWSGHDANAVLARRLVSRLLAFLFQHGWVLAFATNVSKKLHNKDTLVFRLQEPAPAPRTWMAISFSRYDLLRFIDAPPAVVQDAVETFGRERAVQHYIPHARPGAVEFKLRGTPWNATAEETVQARRYLLILLGVLERHGFTVYASVDQKIGTENKGKTDTWHLCRQEDWSPGLPVFHA